MIQSVLVDHRSLTQIAKHRGLTRQALSHRFRRLLETRFDVPQRFQSHDDSLILLADGMWFKFKGRPWVLYLMALRPVKADEATFIDPLLLEGPESKRGWQKALSTIASNRLVRVCALVGDKFKGCRSIAAENGWILQLCHYHMTAQLERSRTKRQLKLKARTLRREAYRLVKKALATSDWKELEWIVFCLKAIIAEPALPVAYQRALRGFLRHMEYYHTYIAYPNLRLPRTNNTSEAMARRIRDLMGRTRSLSSPESLKLWATEYVRRKPVIACRPA